MRATRAPRGQALRRPTRPGTSGRHVDRGKGRNGGKQRPTADGTRPLLVDEEPVQDLQTGRPERPYPLGAIALFGATFQMRILSNFVFNAGRVIMPSAFQYPIRFVDTEKEGRAFLAEVRKTRALSGQR
jgi:hypothetical protein